MVALAGLRPGRARELTVRPPWWPLAMLVYGYPLWWLLGVTAVVPVVMAAVMVRQLWRSRPVVLPRGTVLWLLFLVWVGLGVMTLWVDAPGAVPGGGPSRLVPFAYRVVWYLTCTVVLLWMANAGRRSVPTSKIVEILGWMFVIAAFGGLLGVLLPGLELRSAVELLLPGGVRGNSFVRSLVHPALADVQNVLGRPEARPKAPFPFANTWGSVTALSLPFFLIAWVRDGDRRRRIAAVGVLLVASVPIVYSLNRGLWACLVAGVVILVVLQGWRGRPWRLVAILLVGLVAAVGFALSPLGTVVGERFDNQHSNDRRAGLLVRTVTSAAEGSPVVGFGSTRDVQGSFASIAGGATPGCPACEVPPLGTQGHLWLVIFSQGLVGAAFFLGFFGSALLRSLRCRTDTEVIATTVLVFFAIQLFVYDTLGIPLLVVMTAIGLAWRDQSLRTQSDLPRFRLLTVPALAARVRSRGRWWVWAPLVAVVVGATMASLQPPRYTATQSILLAEAPSYLPTSVSKVRPPRETTVDTEAALVLAEQTMRRVAAQGVGASDDVRRDLRVTAVANTRVLVVAASAGTAVTADERSVDVARSYLDTRRDYLAQRRDQYLVSLRERQVQLTTAGGQDGRYLSRAQRLELDGLGRAITNILLTPTDAGELLRHRQAVEEGKPYALAVASSLGLGLLAAAFVTFAVRPGRRRHGEPEPARFPQPEDALADR